MKRLAIFLTSVLLAFSVQVLAIDSYEFEDKVLEKRFNSLVKELRCPKCQNQNLADSNAPISKDLKREIYEMLHQNRSDKEIVDFMVEHYTEFVLYRPKVNDTTYILWFGPAILLLIGVIIAVIVLKRSGQQKLAKQLSSQQKEKLEQILKDK